MPAVAERFAGSVIVDDVEPGQIADLILGALRER